MNAFQHLALRSVAGAWNLLRRSGPSRDCILLYHSIHATRLYLARTPDRFRRDLNWLTAHCDVVPLRNLLDPRPAGSLRPRVAITFDDGYLDNYTNALPLLLEYRVPATFFVVAGYVERDPVVLARLQKFSRTSLAELEPMSWEQLREMAGAGFEIGCHTYSHPSLHHLDDESAEVELRRSKQLLEERLDRPVPGFSYPFGKPGCTYGPRDARNAQALGFQYAVSTIQRGLLPRDSPWQLPRLPVGDSRSPLPEQIEGRWDWVGVYNEFAPIPIARALSPRGFRASTYGGSYEEMAATLQSKP